MLYGPHCNVKSTLPGQCCKQVAMGPGLIHWTRAFFHLGGSFCRMHGLNETPSTAVLGWQVVTGRCEGSPVSMSTCGLQHKACSKHGLVPLFYL